MSQRNKAFRKVGRVPRLLALVATKREAARATRIGEVVDEAIRWNV